MRVVVIGAGVIGASIAGRLAQDGVQVTLVDQGNAGSGATGTSYAWINANGKEPDAYFEANYRGLQTHRRLTEAGGNWLGVGGHVEMAAQDSHRDDLAFRVRRLLDRGYRAEEISPARAAELLPDVHVPENIKLAIHFAEETYAYPLLYLGQMLAEARQAGALILENSAVTELEARGAGGLVTLNDGRSLEVDVVVSACGRWTSEVTSLAGAKVPVTTYSQPGDITVGYLMETSPVPVQLTRLVTSPWLNVRPAGGGRLLIQALDLDATADPNNVPSRDSELAREFLKRLTDLIPGAAGAQIDKVIVGQRPMPVDGRTIAGWAPNAPWLYVVATHSGVTLAPYLGQAVSAEIVGQHQPLLDAFRLERFDSGEQLPTPYRPRKPGQQ